MAGHSTAAGFRLLGEVPTDALQAAVEEALRRMQGGEAKLAVHPNCGTNSARRTSDSRTSSIIGWAG